MTVKQLKQGDFFTTKQIENPAENQVYIRGEYDRTTRRYICARFSDMNSDRLFKGDREIYTDFIF